MKEPEADEFDASRYDDMVRSAGDIARPLAGFRILISVNDEGEEIVDYKADGRMTQVTVVGHLLWAAHVIMRNADSGDE